MKGLRLSLFLSLPPSPFPLPSPISLKMEEKEEEEKCTLLKHEWITKSRVHSFAPYRPRNPQKVYLSPRATMAYTLAWRRPTFLPSLLTPRPRGIVIGVLLNRYVQETIERERESCPLLSLRMFREEDRFSQFDRSSTISSGRKRRKFFQFLLPVSLGYGWITWLLLLRSSSPPLPFFCLSFTTEHGVTSV